MRKRLTVCLLALVLALAVAAPPVAVADDGGYWHTHTVCTFLGCFSYQHWHAAAPAFKKSCEKCYQQYIACNAAADRDKVAWARAVKRNDCSQAHGRCIADPQCQFPWPWWYPNGKV